MSLWLLTGHSYFIRLVELGDTDFQKSKELCLEVTEQNDELMMSLFGTYRFLTERNGTNLHESLGENLTVGLSSTMV